jgi:hypothetical protein
LQYLLELNIYGNLGRKWQSNVGCMFLNCNDFAHIQL